jgi:hypothetical protein
MTNWSIVGLVSFLGAASFAHAHSSVITDVRDSLGARTADQGSSRTLRSGRTSEAGHGSLTCGPPQLVRPDQGIGSYQDVPAEGGTFSLLVWGRPGCPWGIREDSDMLTDLTPASGKDNVTASYKVLPNTGAARTAVITAASTTSAVTTFEIRQAAAPNAPAPLSNDPDALGPQRTCLRVPISTVKSGAVLKPETYVLSPARTYKLIYQTDGNLVLYRANGEFLWNNGKVNSGGLLKMQTDGNLVSYDAANKALWSTRTHRYPGAFLGVQDDGNVVIYAADSCRALWSIRSAQ